ncbi:N-acetylmuramidase domain-containing protein [Aurantimonas sp. MSK8Z-1]|uniref:N-acetylmuramidase domain-containing protein n=1 Tax=Mangrovibrevibacter kandeliae TaxID=2968473 RepID=UPI00211957CD|nr:N-acetylmuramidase domain-containing protein [Aurantimonas sp. MSK8Z-1]MCW4114362.1 N-acetylmuramidase domain-containing protein [Aurantimonas sp. MSK8Z-1]
MRLDVYEAARRLSEEYGVPAGHVAAIIKVESNGVVSTPEGLPLIRWEGHYFYRLLSGSKRDRAVKAGLASPKVGGLKNPRPQDRRYEMLGSARDIDAEAAVSSTSWGLGQFMGAHWQALGYASAEALRLEAMSGLEGQARLMMRYVRAFGLLDELRAGEWSAFARGYNGPGYRKNRYDEKMAAAAAEDGGVVATGDGILRLGSRGARVRELQALLVRAGVSLKIDGDFGPSTKTVVRRLQKARRLAVDGVVGPETMTAFARYRTAPDEKVGAQKLLELPGADKAAGALAGAAGLSAAKDQIEAAAGQVGDLAGHLVGVPSLASAAEAAASGLVAVAGFVGVAALAYAGWQYLQSRRTYEGVAA